MAEHGAELAAGPAPSPAPARRHYTRPAWATVGTAAAYAVTDNHNGTVNVSVVLVPIKGGVPSCVSIPTDTPPGAETESSTAPSPDQHKS